MPWYHENVKAYRCILSGQIVDVSERNLKPVSNRCMEANDQLLLLRREFPSSNVRPKIIDPSQSATLAASLETCTSKNKNKHNEN